MEKHLKVKQIIQIDLSYEYIDRIKQSQSIINESKSLGVITPRSTKSKQTPS